MFRNLLTLALVGSLGVAGAALASTATGGDMTGGASMDAAEMDHDEQFVTDLQIYAAFAKLEANIAEASAAVILHAFRTDSEARAILAREYFDDVVSIEQYVRLIESYDLNEEQRSAVEEFQGAWQPLSEEGNQIIASTEEPEALGERVYAWWNEVQDVDDTVDVALDGLLEDYGASIEAEVGRYEEVGGSQSEDESEEEGE